MKTVEEHLKRYESIVAGKANWTSQWQAITDYCTPQNNNIYQNMTEGNRRGVFIYDSTAPRCVGLLSSYIHSALTNPMSYWFDITTTDPKLDEEDEVRQYLQTSAYRMHSVMNCSNFHTEANKAYRDIVSLGTSYFRTEEDEKYHVLYQSRPIYEMAVAESNRGFIDTVYRKFMWTARQILQEWPDAPISDNMKKEFDLKRDEKWEILHCVFPRKEFTTDGGPKNYPIASKYILIKTRELLHEGGYHEEPHAVPRWFVSNGETYGRSPAMEAFADIKMLNSMCLTTIRGAQKAVDPTMQAPDEGFVLPIRLVPNGIVYYRAGSRDRLEPVVTGGRPELGLEMMNEVRTSIKDAFFVNQLQLRQADRMTATEVQQRIEESLKILAPMIGRLQAEFLKPVVSRTFAILQRKGFFGEVPALLRDVPVQFTYSSIAARVQRTSELDNFGRAITMIGPIVQGQPSVLDNIDGDASLRYVFKRSGCPQELLRSEVDVENKRMKQAQQVQQSQQIAQAGQLGEATAKMAPIFQGEGR